MEPPVVREQNKRGRPIFSRACVLGKGYMVDWALACSWGRVRQCPINHLASAVLIFLLACFLAVFVVPSPWGLVLVVFAAFIEVGETWFWIHYSRRRKVQVGAETLIGARGVTVGALRPRGQVRLGGEFWDATSETGVEAGVTVRVVGREDLTLHVEPD
jgi:membrane protein implicated in regulation of membrane protease activity